MGTIEEAIIDYGGLGWSLMLLPVGQKKTTQTGWPDDDDDPGNLAALAVGGANLAVRLGERSGQLADVDLDQPAARAVARFLLPPTPARFGRDGVVGMTHYLYLAPDGPPRGQRGTMRLNTMPAPGDQTVTTYAELRWNGGYTVLPPSLHPEGGLYRWENGSVAPPPPGSPPAVAWSTLSGAVREVAAAALLVEAYPELKRLRQRHYTSLALSAALLRAGWPLPRVEKFVYACARACGDEEADARVDNARSTAERLAAGEHLGGWSALVSYLGEGVVTRFQRFLGLDARATSAGTWAGVVSPPSPAAGPTKPVAPAPPASAPKLSVVQPTPGPSRPQVEVGHSDLLRLCEETWGAVALMQMGHPDGPQIFRYGSVPVRIARWGRGGTATTTATLLQSIADGDAIRNALATLLVEFGTMVKGQGGGPTQWVPAYPNNAQSSALYDYLDRSGVPEIELVSGVPLIAPDGSVVTTPGYHAGARMYLEPQLTVPAVPDVPDAATIARCRALWVEEVLGDFPFKGQPDRANALSMCLTPYVRPAIQGPVPLYGITAVVQGTGKTRLAQVALETAFGTDYARMLAVGDGEEARKQITATLKDLPRGVLLDNVDKTLDSAPLAKVLTDSHWSDRILGISTIASYPVLCMWIVTGNNLNYSADLIRRVVPSALDANMERPWQRPASAFKHPELLEWTRAHRADLVWAALVLCRAGLQHLAAQGYRGPTIGSFEHWSRILGATLEAAGVEGFLENLGVLYEQADIDTSQWRDFVSDWHGAHGYSVVNSPKLWTLWNMGDYFDLEGRSDRARQTQLGLLLRKMTGRPLGGKKIAQLDKRAHGYTQWHLLDA